MESTTIIIVTVPNGLAQYFFPRRDLFGMVEWSKGLGGQEIYHFMDWLSYEGLIW